MLSVIDRLGFHAEQVNYKGVLSALIVHVTCLREARTVHIALRAAGYSEEEILEFVTYEL